MAAREPPPPDRPAPGGADGYERQDHGGAGAVFIRAMLKLLLYVLLAVAGFAVLYAGVLVVGLFLWLLAKVGVFLAFLGIGFVVFGGALVGLALVGSFVVSLADATFPF